VAQRPLDTNTAPGWRYVRHLDLMLLVSTVVVSILGVVMVYSATKTKLKLLGDNPELYLRHQATYVFIGLVALVFFAAFDYHRLEELGILAYAGVVLLLLGVMSPVGSRALGAQRWFQLGSFQLQPSSFAVLALILALAWQVQRWHGEIDLKRLLMLLGMGALPVLLVALQPDLGTAITLGCVLGIVLVVAGVPARYLLVVGAIAVVVTVLGLHLHVLKNYQLDRLDAFLKQSDPNSCGSTSAGYNLCESKIAIADGGLTGRGLFHGPQTNLQYVPEQQTDFIFTAVGEQLGFAGAATLLGLFATMLWRIVRTAQLAYDRVGTLLCAGVLAYIAFSVFQNAGMTMGIMPITGIPLPLVSYGGSSTIATFAAVGIVLNVGMRKYR
jgi:rod shape determining protein RodA